MGPSCIIKLGGAAITDKAVFETPRMDIIKTTARQVALASKAKPNMIVVHGAGSYGHLTASKYQVSKGWVGGDLGKNEVLGKGWIQTRSSVLKLNALVTAALVEADLPAVAMSPFVAGWSNSGGEVCVPPSGLDALNACLKNGLIPVLHGECVMDDKLGCSIISGDTIVRYLAEAYHPERVIFLTNVPGVYDRPPEEDGAQLLQTIYVKEDGSWYAGSADNQSGIKMVCDSNDCTGGMSKKVEEAACIALTGIDVVIAQAGSEDAELACSLSSQELRELMKPVAYDPRYTPSPKWRQRPVWRGTIVTKQQP